EHAVSADLIRTRKSADPGNSGSQSECGYTRHARHATVSDFHFESPFRFPPTPGCYKEDRFFRRGRRSGRSSRASSKTFGTSVETPGSLISGLSEDYRLV